MKESVRSIAYLGAVEVRGTYKEMNNDDVPPPSSIIERWSIRIGGRNFNTATRVICRGDVAVVSRGTSIFPETQVSFSYSKNVVVDNVPCL